MTKQTSTIARTTLVVYRHVLTILNCKLLPFKDGQPVMPGALAFGANNAAPAGTLEAIHERVKCNIDGAIKAN